MKKKPILGNKHKKIDNPNDYQFDKLVNRNKKLTYNVRISVPEFTSICPVTGQPDFANIIVDYVPNLYLVESKSFKIFIQSFRNFGIFHEDVTLFIGKSLQEAITPKWIRIAGYFAPRGGIPIDVFWQSGKCPQNIFLPNLEKDHYLINR